MMKLKIDRGNGKIRTLMQSGHYVEMTAIGLAHRVDNYPQVYVCQEFGVIIIRPITSLGPSMCSTKHLRAYF